MSDTITPRQALRRYRNALRRGEGQPPAPPNTYRWAGLSHTYMRECARRLRQQDAAARRNPRVAL